MSDATSDRVYPLSAIVGQHHLVEALLINAVDPRVGGVLVRGERGTAKSTAVRALGPLLPSVTAGIDQPFAFAPGDRAPDGRVAAGSPTEERRPSLVELPLGATLDRLVGSLDLARALAGERGFEPGLLARAHQGILYVDEINLLPDHLVDSLLDAAASGVARVERDAVSVTHDARFLLVGTMNVEEGELRPQLLDRFGLGVEVHGPEVVEERSEIVRRRLAFDRDPDGFGETWSDAERNHAAAIATARERLPFVVLPERELSRITTACARLGIDGARGDIVCARAASALAALEGADAVTEDHVRRAAFLALAHRRRRDPLDPNPPSVDDLDRALDGDDRGPSDEPPGGPGSDGGGGGGTEPRPAENGRGEGLARERRDPPVSARMPPGVLVLPGAGRGPAGRRARSRGIGAGAIDSLPAAARDDDLAIVASLRERIVHGERAPVRRNVRAAREGVLICLVVDASGSMGARRRLARVKGALLGLLGEAYAHRDRVAMVAFRDDDARVLVHPTTPLERAAAAVRALPTGGRTPLAEGLRTAERLIRLHGEREPDARTIAVVLTDGRVPDPDGEILRAAARVGSAASAVYVVDLEEGAVRVGLAPLIARAAGGKVLALDVTSTVPMRRSA